MRCLLLSLVAVWVACVPGRAGENPRTVPLRVEERITDNDAKTKFQGAGIAANEMRARRHDVQLIRGKRYTITMNAVATGKPMAFANRFDPYIVVQDADGKTVAFDDD